eukprot:gene41384-8704_t
MRADDDDTGEKKEVDPSLGNKALTIMKSAFSITDDNFPKKPKLVGKKRVRVCLGVEPVPVLSLAAMAARLEKAEKQIADLPQLRDRVCQLERMLGQQ